MRTTLNLDDELVIRAKVRAAEQRTTLTAVVEAALRAALDERPKGPRAEMSGSRLPFPTWDGGGFPAGLDLSSNAATLEFLERLDAVDGSP